MDYRAILFHKQATSARLRFLRFGYGSVCAFESIPRLAQAHRGRQENPAVHPAQVVQKLEKDLGFGSGCLQVEEGYRYVVEVPDKAIQVILVGITSIDPPFAVVSEIDAEFIDLTQARGLPPVELELLRGAYELVLGG